jgi:hypothetical protein
VKKFYTLFFGLLFSVYFLSGVQSHVAGSNTLAHPSASDSHLKDLRSALDFQNTNFNIRLDINRLKNIQPEIVDYKNLYHFPDSVLIYSVGQNPKRYKYIYSQQGILIQTVIQLFQNNQWVFLSQENFSHDNFGRILSSTTKIYQNGNWINSTKSTYSYNLNGNLISFLSQFWNGNSWVNSERITNSFDVFGNRVAFFSEKWIADNWTNLVYELYSYDQSNNLTSGIRQVWENNTWINDQQYVFNYDSNRNLLNATVQNWVNGIWTNLYKESYIYNVENKPLEYIGQMWQNNNWIFSEKYTYNYNALGYVQMAVGQLWQSNQWINSERGQFSHNSFGGISLSLKEIWNNGIWLNQRLLNYTYDETGNATSTDLYTWNGDTWSQNQDGILELFYSNSVNTIYFVGYKAFAGYTSMLVGTDNQRKSSYDVKISPNPVRDILKLHIDLDSEEMVAINLIKSNGSLLSRIHEGMITKDEIRIDISALNLSSGVYLLQVISDKRSSIKKIIVN